LALAATGLYGLISFLVMRRTQEMGIRIAIGATPARIASMVVKHVLYWSLSGVVIGSAATTIVVRSLRTIVFKVPVENPALFALSACLMVAVAIAAALIPALRATRIDPIATLRQE